jgi:hypothetical protein
MVNTSNNLKSPVTTKSPDTVRPLRTPTLVKLLSFTEDASFVDDKISEPLILYVCPDAMFNPDTRVPTLVKLLLTTPAPS